MKIFCWENTLEDKMSSWGNTYVMANDVEEARRLIKVYYSVKSNREPNSHSKFDAKVLDGEPQVFEAGDVITETHYLG